MKSKLNSSNNISLIDLQTVTRILKKLDPQKEISEELFESIARLISQPIVDVVPWRVNLNTKKIEILFTRRPENDSFWPNQLHTPGVVVRPSDGEDYLRCVERMARDELGGVTWERLNFLMIWLKQSVRGHEMRAVFEMKIANTIDLSKYGEWFPIGKYPKNCIKEQIEWLTKATKIISGKN